MSRIARYGFLPLVFLCAFVAACSNNGNTSANASPSPSAAPTLSVYDTTNAEPQNCVRQTSDFRYYDAASKQPMPFVENYTPYPIGPMIHYFLTTPTPPPAGQTPIAVELPMGSNPPKGSSAFLAVPYVPVLAWTIVYGLNDTSTVLIIPTGQISNDYQKDLVYRSKREMEAESYTYAAQTGGSPTPIPSDDAGAAFDTTFQALGVPALNAISRGANPDDRFFKGYYTLGVPTVDADPHPRIVECDWLEYRTYDLIWQVVRKRQLPPAQLATLKSQLQAQEAPTPLMTSAGFVAYEKDVYVAHSVMPELWAPTIAQGLADSDVFKRQMTYPVTQLIKEPLPAPDDTTNQ